MHLADLTTASTLLGVTNVDPDLAFFTVIVFGLTLLILWRFAWKPIVEGLDRREQSIADHIDQARVGAEKAEATLKEYETKLATAAEQATAILAEAKKEAEAAKERIVSEAQEEAQKAKQRALADIESAKEQAVRELAQKSVDSAVQLAGALVRKELTPDRHAQLIQESLDRFAGRN
jgi:F-type H+-transporting ATPase subunit b